MGKHDARKCRGGAAAARLQARVVVGVRTTRSVAARAAARRRKAVATTAASAERGNSLGRRGCGDTGETGCYLHLRSRRLYFKADAAVLRSPRVGPGAEAPTPRAAELSGGSVEEGVAGTGISLSSSTAPSADVGGREWTQRSGGAREACEDREAESSVSDCGSGWLERRETTPSSRPPGDSSDAESSQTGEEQKYHHRSGRNSTTSGACRAPVKTSSIRMPPAAEIEEFLAAAERAEAARFAAKYNFDVVRGVPLEGGRFEWATAGGG
ncbi:hypothetical protein ABZP36_020768 [Zizania latifolia]